MQDKSTKIECPACGKPVLKSTLIFHMRKKAVFEVYEAHKTNTDISALSCPHEVYIQDNQVLEPKFSIE